MGRAASSWINWHPACKSRPVNGIFKRSSVGELKHFSEKNKRRFMAGFRSLDGPLTGGLEINLTTANSRLTLSAPTLGTIRTMTIRVDEGHYAAADYVPRTVMLSPLGVTVEGHERKVGYEIPVPDVILHFSNGTTITVDGITYP